MPSKRIKVWIGIGSLVGGGAEKQVDLLVNQLNPSTFDIRVGYVRKGAFEPVYSDSVEKRFLKRKSKWRWDSIWRSIWAEFKEWRPDVVHVWLPEVISIPGAVCARLQGIPVITSIRRSNFKGIGLRNYPREVLGLIPHLFSDEIVANFSLNGEIEPLRSYWRSRKALVIPNGVRIATMPCATGEEIISRPAKPLRFIFVGRFAPQKRLPFLIQTLAGIKELDWTLNIYGTGSTADKESLNDLIETEGLEDRVHFEGFVPDWRQESGRYDYMIFPSVSEGMPNVVVEAMAEGLPVVGSRIPELSNILKDRKNGAYFEPDDAASLQSVLRVLPQNDLEYQQLCDGALATAERFSVSALAEAYAKLYKECALRLGGVCS